MSTADCQPPLGENELANYTEWAGVYSRGQTGAEQRYSVHVPRLIAALRAERAEAEMLSAWVGHWSTRANNAEAALRAKDEELQRLRTQLDDTQKELRLAWRTADNATGVSRPLP